MNRSLEEIITELEVIQKGYSRFDCVPVSGDLLFDILTILYLKKVEDTCEGNN